MRPSRSCWRTPSSAPSRQVRSPPSGWSWHDGREANDNVICNPTTGALSYDADRNGAGAAVRFARFAANLALASNDFLIV